MPIKVFCSSPLKQSQINETSSYVNKPMTAPTINLLATIIAKLLIKNGIKPPTIVVIIPIITVFLLPTHLITALLNKMKSIIVRDGKVKRACTEVKD